MIEAILKGFALGLLLVISVGPVVFTIIKQSLNNGHVGGFSFVAGVWVSDFILVILSNAFTELVKQLLEYKQLIGYWAVKDKSKEKRSCNCKRFSRLKHFSNNSLYYLWLMLDC